MRERERRADDGCRSDGWITRATPCWSSRSIRRGPSDSSSLSRRPITAFHCGGVATLLLFSAFFSFFFFSFDPPSLFLFCGRPTSLSSLSFPFFQSDAAGQLSPTAGTSPLHIYIHLPAFREVGRQLRADGQPALSWCCCCCRPSVRLSYRQCSDGTESLSHVSLSLSPFYLSENFFFFLGAPSNVD